MSGMGSGYLSGNMLVAFPFADGQRLDLDADETRSEALQQAIQACFVDAMVCLRANSVPVSVEGGWPSVGRFSCGSSSVSFSIGAMGAEVDLEVHASGSKFPVVHGSAPWGSYVATLSSAGIEALCSDAEGSAICRPDPGNSSPGRDGCMWLKLCPRCVVCTPVGLSSIRVFDGVKPMDAGPHFVLSGDVSFKPGNNMQLSEREGVQGFALEAVPGSGLGVVPCVCDDSRRGNEALAGPDGHARIFNDTCYDIEPGEKYRNPSTGRWSQELKIHGKCTACCSCEMYAEMVDRLSGMADRVRGARERRLPGDPQGVYDIYRSYESAVKSFNDRLNSPRLPEDATLTLSGMPVGRNVSPKIQSDKVKGKMSRCAFTAILRNSSFFEILATVNSMTGSDDIVEATVAWSSESGSPLSRTSDSKSGIVGATFSVFPGRSLVVTYISSRRGMVNSVVTGGFSGSISMGLSYRAKDGSTRSLGSVKKTVSV